MVTYFMVIKQLRRPQQKHYGETAKPTGHMLSLFTNTVCLYVFRDPIMGKRNPDKRLGN